MSITTLIKVIQDIMRKDVGVDGDAQRISQICWLLFLKIYDDKETEWELTRRSYKSPLPNRFRWRNWAKDPEGDTGEDLIGFVNNDLFPELKQLASKAGVSAEGRVVGSVFEDAYNYMKSGTLLRQVINTIEADVDFNSSKDRHLFNDIYEKILADLQSAGNAGEYYTPRAVTQFMVDMLNPQLGEKILDPACGTGGFLICCIEALKKQAKTAEDLAELQKCIHGVEKKPLPHMLAMTNMLLHGIDVPTNILHDNTLSRPYKDYGPRDRVDIIVTNPPFGGVEEDGIEKNFLAKHQTRETADLFMALIMHLLKHDTGRAAVVLPDGFLFGEGVKTTLKKQLLEEFNLHTIVRLPKGVFSPYTSINTNLLFFEKGGPTKMVWFFEHPYPDGYKSYSRSKPLTIDEFGLEKKWWGGAERRGRKPSEYAWKISAAEIVEKGYNLDAVGRHPHQNEVNHGDPEELMRNYQRIGDELQSTQTVLKTELIDALNTAGGDIQARRFLSQHFGEFYAIKENVAELRNTIIELAVLGKLVPQNPGDSPASELIDRIDAERTHLIRAGKIRGPKSPATSTEMVDVPLLPHGWIWTPLQSLVAVVTDGDHQPPPKAVSGVPFLVIGNLNKMAIDFSDCRFVSRDYFNALDWSRKPKRRDLLYTVTGSYGIPIVVLQDNEFCVQRHVAILKSTESTPVEYLAYFLRSRRSLSYASKIATGIAQKTVPLTGLRAMPVPLPPLAEQRRIVVQIDKLMSVCHLLEKQIDAAKETQSALLRAILAQFESQQCA